MGHLVTAHPGLKFVLVREDDKDGLAEALAGSLARFYDGIPKLVAPQAKQLIDILFPNKAERLTAAGLAAFEDVLMDRVPKERLLIFSHGDGWEPLCEFLNIEVPPETVLFPAYDDGTAKLDAATARTRRILRTTYIAMGFLFIMMFSVLSTLFAQSTEWMSEILDSYRDLAQLRAEQPDMSLGELASSATTAVRQSVLRMARDADPAVFRPEHAAPLAEEPAASAGGATEESAAKPSRVVTPLSVKRYTVAPKPTS